MHSNFSRWAVCALTCLFACSGYTSELLIVNGSQSNTVGVANAYGTSVVQPGLSLVWPLDENSTNAALRDGTNVFWWLAQPGHDYRVACSTNGVALADNSASQTHWFWWGFSFYFCFGMMGLGAAWVRRLAGGTNG